MLAPTVEPVYRSRMGPQNKLFITNIEQVHRHTVQRYTTASESHTAVEETTSLESGTQKWGAESNTCTKSQVKKIANSDMLMAFS